MAKKGSVLIWPAWILGIVAGLYIASAGAAVVPGAPASGAPISLDKLTALARSEGHVTVYSSNFGAAPYKTIVAAFETKYGIKVDSLDIRASEMYERVRVEQTTGHNLADIVMQPKSAVTVIERAGLLQNHGEIPNLANLRSGVTATPIWVPLYTALYGILVNAKVPLADQPKTWQDLLDPKWRGKLLLDDPRTIGNGFSLFNATYKGFGPQYQVKLSQNAPVLSRQVRNDEKRIARGEYPLYAPFNFSFFGDLQGLPVRFVFPSDGSPNADTQGVIVKNAPHPNAARLFLNYMLEPDSQVVFGNSGLLPVVQGVATRLNPELKQMFAVKELPQVNVDEMNAEMAKAKELYP